MTRTGLIGLFLLPLAFAALPLAAMAVSASNDSPANTPRIEIVASDEPAAAPEVEKLGFNTSEYLAADCSGATFDLSALTEG